MDTSILRPLIVSGLLDSTRCNANSEFKQWISAGQYLLYAVPSSRELDIGVNDDDAFHRMLAYDCCRMASASFETMFSLQARDSHPKSFAWLAIKSYYASFFAAHSILRCFGIVCSQLERGHVLQINQFASVNGLSNSLKVEAGLFVGNFTQGDRTLRLKKAKNSHQDTWAAFASCISKLANDVLNVPGLSSEKQILSAELDSLALVLNKGGGTNRGDFLSEYRNRLNYRQEYDAWYPYGKSSIPSSSVNSLMSHWNKDELPAFPQWKGATKSHTFFVTCLTIVNLCYKLTLLVNENSSSKRNMFEQWPIRFLNIH